MWHFWSVDIVTNTRSCLETSVFETQVVAKAEGVGKRERQKKRPSASTGLFIQPSPSTIQLFQPMRLQGLFVQTKRAANKKDKMPRGKLSDIFLLFCFFISIVVFLLILKMQWSTEYVLETNPIDIQETKQVPLGMSKSVNTSDQDASNSMDIGSAYPVSKFYTVWHEDDIARTNGKQRDIKKIVVFGDGEEWDETIATTCPSDTPPCNITLDIEQSEHADAVVFYYSRTLNIFNSHAMPQRNPQQYWVFFSDEAPLFPRMRDHDFVSYSGVYNLTMTYRLDSDIPAQYGSLYGSIFNKLKEKLGQPNKDYSMGKQGIAVWFVSNCYKYLLRFAYAKDLATHMDLDIFGKCGKVACPDFDCSDMIIKRYKFYLSFESYQCRDYITEKFWRNALENEAVPVVFGAPKKDYEKIAPLNSFIHVDDFASPKDLAAYLKELDQDKERYNEYFRWRKMPFKSVFDDDGSVWCRLCKKLHDIDPTEKKVYSDLDRWLKGENYELCKPVVMMDYNNPQNNLHFGHNFTS